MIQAVEPPLAARDRRPDLFIIGAAKAGTTSLYEYLRGHPEIFMSPAKEPRYFAPDVESGARSLRYGEDLHRYLALFEGARDEKRLGEASVRYMYSREAPRLIRDFQPNAYIVAMLRNPVDMMYSLHGQLLSHGVETNPDFEQALAAELGWQGVGARHGSGMPLRAYRARARYGEQLPRWIETFGPGRVHVIVFEEFVREPAPAFRRLLEFLEVDPDYQPVSFAAHNRAHAPRSRVLRSLAPGLRQLVVKQLLPRVAGERTARRVVRKFRHSRLYRRDAPRLPLRPELRRQLELEFADDVAQLSKFVGRDLAALWWTTKGEVEHSSREEPAAHTANT